MSRVKLALFSLLILFLILSCNMISLSPATPTVDSQAAIDNAVLQTQQALTLVALSVQQTIAVAGGGAPPPALPTNTYQFTDTPSIISVTVSVDTNCRTGPGSAYSIVGALLVGQTAEVVGRSASSDNWIVKLPGKTTTCWLWAYYATVTGSTSGLPIVAPPPTPTFTVSPFISITIQNNSAETFCSVFIAGSDDPSWGSNELFGILSPGDSYTWYDYLPDVYDVLVQDCWNNTLQVWFNIDMFTNTWLVYP